MKRLVQFCLAAAILTLAATALAADPPSLVGTWEGTPSVYGPKLGFAIGKTLDFSVTEQKGNVFHGVKTYYMRGKVKRTEKFSGSIDSQGQVFMADHDEGAMQGRLTPTGELELQYGHAGRNAVVVHVVLKRK